MRMHFINKIVKFDVLQKTMKIYHNPRCSKSRAALTLLQQTGGVLEIQEYLKNAPDKNELIEVLKKLNMKPHEIIRKGEVLYKEKYKGSEFTDEEWINIMVENPVLIERPIVIKGDKAIIARPPERINELL